MRLLAAHGLPSLREHGARHTAATVLLELGVGPRVVMELMGWSSMQMVTRYQHVLDEMKEVVAGQVGDALFGADAVGRAPAPGPGAGVVDLGAFRARRTG